MSKLKPKNLNVPQIIEVETCPNVSFNDRAKRIYLGGSTNVDNITNQQLPLDLDDLRFYSFEKLYSKQQQDQITGSVLLTNKIEASLSSRMESIYKRLSTPLPIGTEDSVYRPVEKEGVDGGAIMVGRDIEGNYGDRSEETVACCNLCCG